jgi:hypothetical protein
MYSNAEIRVSDMHGKIILTETNANGNYFSIDVKRLEAGLYFLQITNKENTYSVIWIKG